MEPKHPDFRHPEIIHTHEDQVSCDGGGGPAGHPRIYMSVDTKKGYADCTYCDRRFVKTGDGHGHGDHPLISH